MAQYRYAMHSTGESSRRFGPCEVCGKPCSEVFYQLEERLEGDGHDLYWTMHACHCRFGHEQCLIEQRRQDHIVLTWDEWTAAQEHGQMIGNRMRA